MDGPSLEVFKVGWGPGWPDLAADHQCMAGGWN